MVVKAFPGRGLPGWFWHLEASNGEILAVSESYTRKWSALRAARKLVKLLPNAVIQIERAAP